MNAQLEQASALRLGAGGVAGAPGNETVLASFFNSLLTKRPPGSGPGSSALRFHPPPFPFSSHPHAMNSSPRSLRYALYCTRYLEVAVHVPYRAVHSRIPTVLMLHYIASHQRSFSFIRSRCAQMWRATSLPAISNERPARRLARRRTRPRSRSTRTRVPPDADADFEAATQLSHSFYSGPVRSGPVRTGRSGRWDWYRSFWSDECRRLSGRIRTHTHTHHILYSVPFLPVRSCPYCIMHVHSHSRLRATLYCAFSPVYSLMCFE